MAGGQVRDRPESRTAPDPQRESDYSGRGATKPPAGAGPLYGLRWGVPIEGPGGVGARPSTSTRRDSEALHI